MKNKILVEVEVPMVEKTYDLYIPVNKRVGTIKRLLEEAISEITDRSYKPSETTNFFSKETGMIYDVNQNVRDTDLKNGSRIILI